MVPDPLTPFTRYAEERKVSGTLPYIELFFFPQEVCRGNCCRSGIMSYGKPFFSRFLIMMDYYLVLALISSFSH